MIYSNIFSQIINLFFYVSNNMELRNKFLEIEFLFLLISK